MIRRSLGFGSPQWVCYLVETIQKHLFLSLSLSLSKLFVSSKLVSKSAVDRDVSAFFNPLRQKTCNMCGEQCDQKKSPNVYKSYQKMISLEK